MAAKKTRRKAPPKRAAERSPKRKTRRVCYVLSTHWDREWYQSFQNYRYQLVHLLDDAIEGLETGRMRGPFTMDGQAILIEDYLEVRPEREAQMRALIAAGKMRVGPWYVLPDEFLIAGESFIRNIQLGRRIARDFGGVPSNAGFVCDLFGHISQLPQILAGFGIEAGLVWRGIEHEASHHVVWRGADGTELICYKFVGYGYCDYCFHVRGSERHGEPFDLNRTRADLAAYLEKEAARTEIDTILLFDGGDHQVWDRAAYAAIEEAIDSGPSGYRVEHTDLDAYLADMLAQRGRIAARLEGELREPLKNDEGKSSFLIQGVLSSRVPLKQRNAACEAGLALVAEPLATLASAAAQAEFPRGFLDVAWRWLLKNHPHDSIGGCSIDQVHDDMDFRFSQCEQIAGRLAREAMLRVAANVEGEPGAQEVRVVFFNPLPEAFDGVADLTLELPVGNDYPSWGEFFGFEAKPAFRIRDERGREVPYQRTGQSMNRSRTRLHRDKFPQGVKINEVRVSLALRVPAVGYTTLTIVPGERRAPGERYDPAGKTMPTRYPTTPSIVAGPARLANEHLSVETGAGGTLTIATNGKRRTVIHGLRFEDVADIGDGWHHGPPVNDAVLSSAACAADVAVIEDGPEVGALRIVTYLRVPDQFDFAAMERSPSLVEIPVETIVRLRRGAMHLEFETKLDNGADDHRLRVVFEGEGVASKTYLADSAFDVVERPSFVRDDNHLYRELETATKPQLTWSAIYDARRRSGLATISTGLLESAVTGTSGNGIALTLFRATRRTVMTDGEPGGQLRGPLSFRYWLHPLAAPPDRAALCRLGQRLATGLPTVHLAADDVKLHRSGAVAAQRPAAGLIEIEGAAVATSIQQAEDGSLLVRLFNPNEQRIDVGILRPRPAARGCRPLREAQPIDFEGAPAGPALKADRGKIRLRLGAKKIATLLLR